MSVRLIALARAADSLLGSGSVVDSYVGPPIEPTTERLDRESLTEALEELEDLAKLGLRADTKSSEPELIDIAANTKALRARLLSGTVPYREALAAAMGVEVPTITEASVDELRHRLLTALSQAGYGTGWPDAVHRWYSERQVDAKEYLELLQDRAGELREVAMSVLLPPIASWGAQSPFESRIRYETVRTSEQWAAYHVYEGRGSSLIQVNDATVFTRDEAAVFASHEVFPGHHFDSAVKEALYLSGQASTLATASLLSTPLSFLAEGIADFAVETLPIALSPQERVAFLHDELVTRARHITAIDVIEERIDAEEGALRLSQMASIPISRARQAISFAQSWVYYFPSYVAGRMFLADMVRKHGQSALLTAYRSFSPAGLEHRLLIGI